MRLSAACVAMVVLALLTGTQAAASGSSTGTQAWDGRQYAGEPSMAWDVAVTPDGRTEVVTGSRTVDGTERMVTVARDATSGALRWTSTWPSDPTGVGRADGRGVTTSPDGARVYAVGYTACGDCPSPSTWTVLAFDTATGDHLWTGQAPVAGLPTTVVVSGDGATIVVYGAAGQADQGNAIRAFSTVDGSLRWSRGTNGPTAAGDGLALSSDGSTVYAIGSEYWGIRDCTRQFDLSAFDATTGELVLATDNPSGVCAEAASVGVGADGATVVVTGTADPPGESLVTAGFDATTGRKVWSVEHPELPILTGDLSPDLSMSPDGATAYVNATADVPGRDPTTTIAYDVADGHERWRSHYDGGGDAFGLGLDASPDGSRVYVTGVEQMRCGSSCVPEDRAGVLVAIEAATGAQQWVARYPGGLGVAVASSPDGTRAFLAGRLVADAASGAARQRARAACTGDRCGMASAAYNDRAKAWRAQEADVGVRTGSWAGRFVGDALGGALRMSRLEGATASYTSARTSTLRWVTRVGPSMGKARLVVDGRSRGVFDLYARQPARRTITLDGLESRRHQVRLEVLGRRNASSRGQWVALDAFELPRGRDLVQEHSARLRYGAWRTLARRAADGGQVRWASSPRGRTSVSFSGSRVTLLTARGPSFGRARVAVDGVERVVNLYAARTRWKVPVAFTGLGRGRHTISVRPTGTKDRRSRSTGIVVDAVDVRP